MDRYSSFAELQQYEIEGKDYAILSREVDSPFAVMAPHGGGIEPGTIDIADAVAGKDHAFYAFKGLKFKGNHALHINSNRYDEPTALHISRNAVIVVSIHGCRDQEEIVFIGGKNQQLKQDIISLLGEAGFNAVVSEIPGLRGIRPDNICNQCRSGEGVQVEISRGLREKMFDNLTHRSVRKKTISFYSFVNSIRTALDAFGPSVTGRHDA